VPGLDCPRSGPGGDIELGGNLAESADPIVFPEHALLIVEERLREQEAEGVRIPQGMALAELALRVVIAAQTRLVPHLGD
jgi:hypothetical protein